MGTLAALFQTLGDVGQSYAKARQERADEEIKKKQIYSQLESAALQREHLKKIIQQMSANPQAKEIADIEAAIKRPLTDLEKQRHFGIAPKESTAQPKVAYSVTLDPKNPKSGMGLKVAYNPYTGEVYSSEPQILPRGFVPSVSITKDPLTNLLTVTTREPVLTPSKNPFGNAPAAPPAAPKSPLALLTTPPPGQPQLAGKRRGAGPLARRANPEGMLQPGNINLSGRPILHNPDGTISSEQSFSIGTDKGEVLIPLIVNGKRLTQQQAIEHYRQTGEHMGIFDTPAHADAYATQVHNRKLTSAGAPIYVYQGGAGPLAKRPSSSTAPLPLDAEGHIPPSAKVNPYVRETANELLDGKDMDKVRYSKLIPVASELARKYGWEQGKFTPKEQGMLRVASTFIRRAMTDNSMRALDEGGLSRLRLQQIAQNPEKEGFIGRALTLGAATGMSDSQRDFLQSYNQMVGTISGLSQLIRPGRGTTEATIDRLKAELPNPTNTRDSKDAQQRLQRIVDEIEVAMKKGTFDPSEGAVDPVQQFIDKMAGGKNASPK